MNFRSFSTLQIALGASIAVHAVLLTVRFIDPEGFNRIFQDTPLEVILVNAKSLEKTDPAKASAIAQHTLAGGGDAEKGRATTPLPPSALTEAGDANEDARRQIEALQQQQMMLLSQIRRQLAAMPIPDPNRTGVTPTSLAIEEKRRQLVDMLAEIERRVNEENARPKKRYISPATREEVYATYYDGLRRKIEDKGTENFPEAAGTKIYGELTMIVTINHDGTVLQVEVVQTSGNPTLDRRAMAIARAAGPFGSFSEAMRRQADQIVVVSRFRFTRDETLETKLTNR
ncbi:MAG: TonB C-terminal domain-containing protein [Burkholderiaceae bacterium]|nr:TonB C-terminal domain-containing protein [Burkholderiaceae bacterium]